MLYLISEATAQTGPPPMEDPWSLLAWLLAVALGGGWGLRETQRRIATKEAPDPEPKQITEALQIISARLTEVEKHARAAAEPKTVRGYPVWGVLEDRHKEASDHRTAVMERLGALETEVQLLAAATGDLTRTLLDWMSKRPSSE